MNQSGFTTFSLHERGFTLIELLVVIAIIGILFGIVLIGLNPAQRVTEANTAKAQVDLNESGKLLLICITAEQINGRDESQIYQVGTGSNGCGDTAYLISKNYNRIWNQQVKISLNTSGSAFCLEEMIKTNSYYYYSTKGGVISATVTADCPLAPYSYP